MIARQSFEGELTWGRGHLCGRYRVARRISLDVRGGVGLDDGRCYQNVSLGLTQSVVDQASGINRPSGEGSDYLPGRVAVCVGPDAVDTNV